MPKVGASRSFLLLARVLVFRTPRNKSDSFPGPLPFQRQLSWARLGPGLGGGRKAPGGPRKAGSCVAAVARSRLLLTMRSALWSGSCACGRVCSRCLDSCSSSLLGTRCPGLGQVFSHRPSWEWAKPLSPWMCPLMLPPAFPSSLCLLLQMPLVLSGPAFDIDFLHDLCVPVSSPVNQTIGAPP